MDSNGGDFLALNLSLGIGLVASSLFFLSSYMLFPYMMSIIDGMWYFSYMFLIGSILMLIQSALQFAKLLGTNDKPLVSLGVAAVTLVGWLAFLVGSVLGSPLYGIRDDRDKVYIWSTLTLLLMALVEIGTKMFSNGFKVWYSFSQSKPILISNALLSFSMLLLLIGSSIFLRSSSNPTLSVVGVPFYVLGSLTLLIKYLYLWGINSANKNCQPKSSRDLVQLQQVDNKTFGIKSQIQFQSKDKLK